MGKLNYETINVEVQGAIAVAKINRSDAANALNLQMLKDFKKLCDDMRTEVDIDIIIITGEGKHFCAGADISRECRDHNWYLDPQPNERLYQRHGQDTLHALENLDQITIAAVNGVAMGWGLGVCTACDIRIAADNASFSVPEAKLGFIYSIGATSSLINAVGPTHAKWLIFTGERIRAQRALEIGLVSKIVPVDKLMEETMNWAHEIDKADFGSLRINKKIINAETLAKMYDICIVEPELVHGSVHLHAQEEGMAAFREKREPHFPRD